MTEGVICAIIAGITAVAVGIIDYLSQRKTKMEIKEEMKRNKAERLEHEHNKEQARKEFELCMVRGIMASNSLSEATAKAVQRIPDCHCNGDMTAALEEEEKSKKEIREFLAKQGVENIVA